MSEAVALPPQKGIDLHLIIYREDDADVEDDVVGPLLDAIIEVIEGRNLICGGGMKPIDVNSNQDDADWKEK